MCTGFIIKHPTLVKTAVGHLLVHLGTISGSSTISYINISDKKDITTSVLRLMYHLTMPPDLYQ